MSYYAPQTPQHPQQAPMTPQPGSSPGGSQYQQYYQQPQNIYQQLGQAQPQPHLQRLYQQQSQSQYQQPQPQPGGYAQTQVQSHGFVQRPVSTSYQHPQQTFVSTPQSHAPFQQVQHQPAYAQQPQRYQSPQYNNALQQPPRPISRAPSATGFAPAGSYATPQSYQAPLAPLHDPNAQLMTSPSPSSSSLLAQQMQQHQLQRRTPQPPTQGYAVQEPTKPPPVAPSALLAQQAQVHARRSQQAPSLSQTLRSNNPPSSQPVVARSQQMQIRQMPQNHAQQQQQPSPQRQNHMQMQPQQHPLQRQQPQPQPTPSHPTQQLPNTNCARRPLPAPSADGSPNPSTGLGLTRSGTTTTRPMSMPPTATGRIAPISTASSALAQFNQQSFGGQAQQQQQQEDANVYVQNQTPMSASTIPPPSFVQRQIQQLQQMQNQSRMNQQQTTENDGGMSSPVRPPSASPTKRRPLPAAPGSSAGATPAKRATIDLGNVSGLPTPNTGSAFAFTGTPSSVGSSSSADNGGGGGGYFEDRQPGTSSSVPSGSGFNTSRTTSMAAGSTPSKKNTLQNNDDTPKRRASPPRFGGPASNGSSLSSSPTKEESNNSQRWPLSSSGGPGAAGPSKPIVNPFSRSTTDLSSSTSSKHATAPPVNPGGSMNASSVTSSSTTPKKFTPVWKRTIPDYPAPVFGYAAGMVADPFAKPTKPTNASTTNLSSSTSSKPALTTADLTPKAAKTAAKEQRKAEKEEKKRAKEEEKQRRKAAKSGVVAPMQASPTPSTGTGTSSPGSMLPYLHATPPGDAKSKAFAHGQFQHQHQMMRNAYVAPGQEQSPQQYPTPPRQIQVRGQPVTPQQPVQHAPPPPPPQQQYPQQQQQQSQPSGAVARYTQPLQPQSSTSEESTEDGDEDDDDEDDDEDPQKAYEYEGSDYSESTSEHGYVRAAPAPAPAPAKRARSKPRSAREQQEEEERMYQEYLAQKRAKKAGKKVVGRHSRYEDDDEDDDEEEEEEEMVDQRKRASPNARYGHVKTLSSASDGFVVVQKSGPGGALGVSAARKSPSGGTGRSPNARSRGQSYSYSNSESDDWEQLQAYEASPRRKGKGRRYEEPSEEDEDEEDEEDEELELRRRYEEKRKRGVSGHRREMSERDAATLRKYQQEYGPYTQGTPRAKKGSPTKAATGARGARERVQDIDWGRQQQQTPPKVKQYKQKLKYDDEEDDEELDDEHGRGRQKKKPVAKKASKGNFVKDILTRSRSRSKHRYTEPEEEEEVRYSNRHARSKSESEPLKKSSALSQSPRKLMKKSSRRNLASAPESETESQADDNESVVTTNTQTSAAGRLVSKFAGVMKFSGTQPAKQQPQALSSSQSRRADPHKQQSQQRQSGFSPPQPGFQKQPSTALFFGISDTPPASATLPQSSSKSATFTSVQSSTPSPSSRVVRGEVNRSKVGLKVDNLDDPPPRSLRTPSPSPGQTPRPQSMHQDSNNNQQQRQPRPQSQQQPMSTFQQRLQQRRPQSQIYDGTPRSSFMDDVPGRSRGNWDIVQGQLPQQQQRRQPPRPQPQEYQQQNQQPMSFDPATGLPVHHQQTMQGYAPPPQPAPLSRPPSQRQLAQQHQQQQQQQQQQYQQQQYESGRQSMPSTPRQQQPINIESPAPLKMADILKMEQDGMAHEQRQERQQKELEQQRQQQQQQQYQSPSIPTINIGGPVASPPQINIHHTGGTVMSSGTQRSSPMIPIINFDPVPPTPMINVSEAPSGPPANGGGQPPPNIQVFEIPGVSVSGPEFDEFPSNKGGPQISISVIGDSNGNGQQQQNQNRGHPHQHQPQQARFVNAGTRPAPARSGTGGLICGGCQGPIVGRIVSAMGVRWHPHCFSCTVCKELLEHVSSYEHDGRPYCHLDYHENFAPRCYSCKTPIIEEQFISLDDPALGKRTYHMEHFFCAECGDPFLTPSMANSAGGGELALSGDGDFEGFTVYKGHPYCEPCHVRLRLPKCKKCKKSIRDHDRAVEALGGKWCWSCFVCDGCEQPFEDPSFFQRDNRPYCENCFSIILRNEI